jgi:hypothetical protein
MIANGSDLSYAEILSITNKLISNTNLKTLDVPPEMPYSKFMRGRGNDLSPAPSTLR